MGKFAKHGKGSSKEVRTQEGPREEDGRQEVAEEEGCPGEEARREEGGSQEARCQEEDRRQEAGSQEDGQEEVPRQEEDRQEVKHSSKISEASCVIHLFKPKTIQSLADSWPAATV